MSSNLLFISPKKNNGRILKREKVFDFQVSELHAVRLHTWSTYLKILTNYIITTQPKSNITIKQAQLFPNPSDICSLSHT